jgi:hypothetical protein
MFIRFLMLCLLASIFAACGGGGGGGGGGDDGGGDGGGGQPPLNLEPELASIQAKVFTPRCGHCHRGADAPHGLRLIEGESYTYLVGVPSVEVPTLDRVDPGNPDDSYLIQKLEGTAPGARMPLGGSYLTQDDIDIIRQWITDGAIASSLSSTAPAKTEFFSVVTATPAHQAELTQPPSHITIAFNHPLDASRIDPVYFRIEASGGDGTFDDGNERIIVPQTVRPANSNPYAVVLSVAQAQFGRDTFKISVLDYEGTSLQDTSGRRLRVAFSSTFKVE